jgi:ArsR family transcriptional regulator, arsenate/arsenite/antimonite-responsive transcriptional repressor
MDRLAGTFKALSDETRLQIMTLLLDRDELCVCDFVEALSLTQSKASRHLRYLYHAGLVEDRREGLWMHYRISRRLSEQQKTIVDALARAVSADEKRELERRLSDWMQRKDAGAAESCAGQSSGQAAACC